MNDEQLPFSVRYGGQPQPPQLAVGELNREARNLLWSNLYSSLENDRQYSQLGYGGPSLGGDWYGVAKAIWVFYLIRPIDEFSDDFNFLSQLFKGIIFSANINQVFDFIEFVLKLNFKGKLILSKNGSLFYQKILRRH